MEKKKIGATTAILMGIGTIIGTGIFGTLPVEVNSIRSGVILALIGAIIFVIFKSVSAMYVSSVISCNSIKYVSTTKLIHPVIGYVNFIAGFNMPIMAAMYGILFADYFLILFPDCPLSATAISVLLVLFYGVICWLGVKTASNINNAFVVLLIITIFLFVFAGVPQMDWSVINFQDAVSAGMSLTTLGASIGVFHTALNGAADLATISDEVKHPTRTIPMVIILCPCLVAVLYMLMAIVTLGHLPAGELTNLSQVADQILSPGLAILFVVGGPIAGIVTSLMPVMLQPIAIIEMGAQTKVLPQWFAKANKHGVAWLGLVVSVVITVTVILTGIPYSQLMRAFSFIGTFSSLAYMILPLILQKKYPNSCKHSFVKVPTILINILSIAGFIYSLYLLYGLIASMDTVLAVTLVVVFVLGYLWLFIRTAYLRKQGVDLMAELKAPFEPWEKREAELAGKKE